MATALGVLAQSNTSDYIVGGIDTYITDNGGSKTVDCYLYFRRTNTYANPTWSSSVDGTVTIDGTSASTRFSPNIPGYNNNWIGPYVHAAKTFTGGAKSITVSWSTTDNVSPYRFGGSGSATITVPASYTAPTGLTRSNDSVGTDSITADVSVTGWGTGGSTAQHYVELSVCTAQNTTTRSYTKAYIGDSLSGTITVDNTADTTVRNITIGPNNRYYLTQYATNGAADTGNSSFTAVVTPCLPPAQFEIVPGSITDTSATIRWALNSNSGHYLQEQLLYTIDGGVNWLDATSGDIELNLLDPDTQYTATAKTIGYVSNPEFYVTESEPVSITFTTKKSYKAYGSVNGETAEVTKIYGSVNGQTKEIVAIYGSDNGVTKRIY
jgi:hypothetical protein